MKVTRYTLPVAFVLLAGLAGLARSGDDKADVKEKAFEAPNGVAVKVRMEGPYTGDVADAVLRGVLLAYDTEKRLQKEGLAKEFTLEQWNVEAGTAFFDDTVTGVQKGIEEAKATAAKRPSDPYASGKK